MEGSILGWFVPLVGPGQARDDVHRRLEDLSFWLDISAVPTVRCKLPLGARPGGAGSLAGQFSAFLGRTEAGFAVFDAPVADPRLLFASSGTFGLVDEAACSVALCKDGELLGYGAPVAARRLTQAFRRWSAFGLPGMAAFGLEVVRREEAPPATGLLWIELCNDTALLWRLAGALFCARCALCCASMCPPWGPLRRPHGGPGRGIGGVRLRVTRVSASDTFTGPARTHRHGSAAARADRVAIPRYPPDVAVAALPTPMPASSPWSRRPFGGGTLSRGETHPRFRQRSAPQQACRSHPAPTRDAPWLYHSRPL
jgi:hypothetical protein